MALRRSSSPSSMASSTCERYDLKNRGSEKLWVWASWKRFSLYSASCSCKVQHVSMDSTGPSAQSPALWLAVLLGLCRNFGELFLCLSLLA